jgi:GTPase
VLKPTQNINILLIHLADSRLGKSEIEKDITETWNLIQSVGDVKIVDLFVQKGMQFNATYIGPGKALEIAEYLKNNTDINVISINGILSPNQKFNLTKMYWDINPRIEVWDRVDLILNIFIRHAHTTEAKLQIELARLHHMGPSIFGMGMILSRQGGGIGTRGIGETNTELMKRHYRREIKHITDKLDKLKANKLEQIEHRKNIGLQTISLVGYTNAGKTSLFNSLTRKKNLVENALFATLDSTVGEIFLTKLDKKVIVSDTIGFIKNLPPDLIEAFKSTLLESISADIVLHVIDTSDPEISEKIDVVDKILDQLKIQSNKIMMVFNKIDLIPSLDKQKIIKMAYPYPYVFLSAHTHTGIDELINIISSELKNTLK